MNTKILNAFAGIIMFLMPYLAIAQTAPTLGTTANFVLFTTNGSMTNSGTLFLTRLTGSVGSNLSGTCTGFGNVNGVIHDFDATTEACTSDLLSAYAQLNTATPTNFLDTALGDGDTLIAGVYFIASAATLDSTLILNAQGNPNAVFIFQIQGAFSTHASAKVKLINGAMACNVFWKVEGAVNMAAATKMRGTIVANNGLINMGVLDTLEGRALSINGAVAVSEIVAYMPIGCGSPLLTGPAAPALDSAGTFGVFSSVGGVTGTPITYVVGNIGSNSTATTGFDSLDVTGTINPSPDASTAACAAALTNVYNYLVALPADIDLLDPADFGHGLYLTPHTYQITGVTQFTGNLYLDAEGDANAVFVIKVNGAFTTGTFSNVILLNGTQPKNVYWKIDGAVNIFSNSNFNGTIVAAGAITLNTGDTLNGRALTINGAVAINASDISLPVDTTCVAPAISGMRNVCTGFATTLSDSASGGTWVSLDTAVATIDSSGRLTGITPGTSVITYTSPAGCVSTASITVNSSPAIITGPGSVCVGSSITLDDTSAGGAWSSSNTSLATAGSGTGVVTGVAPGTPTITYTIPDGCIAAKTIIVGAYASNINGPSSVCAGSAITLTDTTAGGTWGSSNTHATVTVIGGLVIGFSAGIDTISYMVTGICGTDTVTKIVTVDTMQHTDSITGPASVCEGSIITLTDNTTGGIWSASNARAIVIGGFVAGVSPGIDTIIYTVTNACNAAAATKIITVNPLPNAGIINGDSSVCIGSSITLTETIAGGSWSASNARATVLLAGLVTGVTAGIDTVMYTVTGLGCSSIASKTVTVDTNAFAGVITGDSSVCPGSSITLLDLSPGGIWSSSNTTATVVDGVVSGVTAGMDTIKYIVSNACSINIATKTITVNPLPNAGVINGDSSVCIGSSITLTETIAGGSWSASNARATVLLAGLVTGVTAGIDTVMYTVTGLGCTSIASKTVTVDTNAFAGVITGDSSVCPGSSITLLDLSPGGIWSSSNTTATVVDGVVSGVTAGMDTIKYIVSNACSINIATKTITVNPLPNAGVINGDSSVCIGSSITLTETIAGGSWSASNARATVLLAGLVTGVTAGIDTVMYTVTGLGCTSIASKTVTVDTNAFAGVITGDSSVCPGSSITLLDLSPGGIWSSSNTTATVVDGVVSGVTAGMDTIKYIVSNACSINIATKTITVNPLPNAGVINGDSSVCIGSSITLTETIAGGSWSASNARATVLLAGLVTGVTAGIDTVMYTVTGLGCTSIASKTVTVDTNAFAGVITGDSSVCPGSSITLLDLSPGGIWSSSNTTATVADGVVGGVTVGMDTIKYIVSNACSINIATKTITVNPLHNAGVINGASSVCIGSSTTLTDTVSGGSWSRSNAYATVVDGLVTGITTGMDTIAYIVSNVCGTDTATKSVTINPLPNSGTITGPSSVCAGSSVILTDVVPGGTWGGSNATATVSGGDVTGVMAGMDTIMYVVSNVCGSDTAAKSITINPLPNAGTITGPSSVCVGSSITLTDSVAGGAWSGSNDMAIVFDNVVIGDTQGIDTIIYTVTDLVCTATTTKAITINPLPVAGNITGLSSICAGSATTFTDPATGGVWSSSNATAIVAGGLVTGVSPGMDTIIYSVTNVCGTDTAAQIITVNPAPSAPVISTQPPSTACTGTMYQNFGAATLPPAGTTYNWTAANATVWAQGASDQYSLVNFNETGIAYVTLNATIAGVACASQTTVTVNVGADMAQTPEVTYFDNHFVCTPSNEGSYQWGYDNITTLDSTILTGEVNQDYLNESPDFANNYYWAMTTSGGCLQKTYYITPPAGVQNVNGAAVSVSIYPNPASDIINVDVTSTVSGQVQVSVFNIMGQKLNTVIATGNKASIDVTALPAGSYLITCYRDGIKIAGATFIKN